MNYKCFIATLIIIFSLPFVAQAQTIYRAKDIVTNYTLYYVAEGLDTDELPLYVYIEDDKENKIIFEVGNPNRMREEMEYVDVDWTKLPRLDAYFVDDYNFDGDDDYVLSVSTEDEGCYRNVSYCVFLSGNIYFVYNEAITALYNESGCLRSSGLVSLPASESIVMATSGGVGSAYEKKYRWEDDKLILVEEIECTYSDKIFIKNEGKVLDNTNNKWKDISFKTIQVDATPIYAFDTANGKGRVMLFYEEGYLYYAFSQGDEERVYFFYPVNLDKIDAYKFTYTETLEGLSQLEFKSGTVTYSIYEKTDTNKKGIKIDVNGKISDWGASRKNALGQLNDLNFLHEKGLPTNVVKN